MNTYINMRQNRVCVVAVFCGIIFYSGFVGALKIPELLLAKVYHSKVDLKNYWISEKYDGVRALWNGKNFISRQGKIFNVPLSFRQGLPTTLLDGELWLARGQFAKLSGLVRRNTPKADDWLNIKFMVFDLPASQQTFDQRLVLLKKIINKINLPQIKLVHQFKVSNEVALFNKLDAVVALGGEGLMLHHGASFYKAGRFDDMLKLKKFFDAEAKVIAYVAGKGKYEGLMGALVVEMANKKRFKVGSGFSDQQRKMPPKIGDMITYKYAGFTKNGLPRFASFLRVRPAL